MRLPARLLAASPALSSMAILGGLLVPASRNIVRLPQVERRALEELAADLYLPPNQRSPGIVLALGALREGRRYPLLVTLAGSVAACGFAVLVPELGNLRRLILDDDALEDLITAVLALPGRPGVEPGPVGMFGFSLGGSLVLLAAADDRLRGRVACVASMGAYFSLRDMLVAATTGSTTAAGEPVRLAAPSVYAVAASLIAGLPERDREALQHVLDDRPDAALEAIADVNGEALGPQAKRVLAVLSNRDPARVDGLLRGPEDFMTALSRLSPQDAIGRIGAPVWVLHDEHDEFVPAQQSMRIRKAAAGKPNFRFLTTRLLQHTEPGRPPLNPKRLLADYLPGVVDLFRFAHGPLAAVRHSHGSTNRR